MSLRAKPFKWKRLCFAWKWARTRNTLSHEWFRTKTRFAGQGSKRQLGSGLLNLQIQSVKDTDKFRLNCWRTERRRFLVPVLKNNNDDVVSNVAFALHLIRKTKPYYHIASHAQLQKKRKIKELGLAFTPQVDRVTAQHSARFCGAEHYSTSSLATSPWRDVSPSQVSQQHSAWLLHQHFFGTHSFTWVEWGAMRTKCLAQEHNAMSLTRAQAQGPFIGVLKESLDTKLATILHLVQGRVQHMFVTCCGLSGVKGNMVETWNMISCPS